MTSSLFDCFQYRPPNRPKTRHFQRIVVCRAGLLSFMKKGSSSRPASGLQAHIATNRASIACVAEEHFFAKNCLFGGNSAPATAVSETKNLRLCRTKVPIAQARQIPRCHRYARSSQGASQASGYAHCVNRLTLRPLLCCRKHACVMKRAARVDVFFFN